MIWKPYSYNGQVFDLSHLDTFEHRFVQAAETEKPERQYRTWIRFSHHCFTESTKSSDDPTLRYGAIKEGRSFDVLRWELSKYLPDIIRSLMGRTISQTGHSNYLTIEILTNQALSAIYPLGRIEYEIYFDVSRDLGDKRLHIVVTSAFPRDINRLADRPRFSKIRLSTILHNVQQNKKIRTTQR